MRLLFHSLIATFVVIVLGLSASFGFLAFVFWEVEGVERGSLTYVLKIPGHVKNFPVFSPCGKMIYGNGFQDGLSPETSSLAYETKLSPAEFQKAFVTATRSLACRLESPRSTGSDLTIVAACAAPRPDLHLNLGLAPVGGKPDCRNVTVLFVEKLH